LTGVPPQHRDRPSSSIQADAAPCIPHGASREGVLLEGRGQDLGNVRAGVRAWALLR